MRIIEMSLEDIPSITVLADQLGYPNAISEIQQRFENLVKLPQNAFFVAKDEGGDVLGWIQVSEDAQSLISEPIVEIAALVVDQNQRSKGIGSALLKRAEEWAFNKGYKSIRLRSNITREAAHRFYLREGYAIVKTSHYFIKEG